MNVPGENEQVPRPKRKHRSAWIAATISLGVVGLLLVVFIAPQYVARHLIATELKKAGVEVQGVESLVINLWDREVWVGPMGFRSADAKEGQVGRFGFRFRLGTLFKRRVSFEEVLISGIDMVVARAETGEFTINGVELSRLLAEFADPDSEEDSSEGSWGAGIDTLELADSHLLFRDSKGRTLAIEVVKLALAGFQTWEPDKPGTFELDAEVNGIQFAWRGEARPFGEQISLTLDGEIDSVELAKVEQFVGPLGFERNGGVLKSRGHYEIMLDSQGKIDASYKGTITVTNGDWSKPEVMGLKLQTAVINVDSRSQVDRDANAQLQGDIDVNLGGLDMQFPDAAALKAGSVRIRVPGLQVGADAGGMVRVQAKPVVEIESLGASGPVQASVEKIVLKLQKLVAEISEATLSVDASGTGDLSGVEATVPAAADAPGVVVAIAGLKKTFSNLTLSIAESGTEIQGAADLSATGASAEITFPAGQGLERVSVSAGEFGVVLKTLAAHLVEGALSLEAQGQSKAAVLSISIPDGQASPAVKVDIGKVSKQFSELAFKTSEQGAEWSGNAEVTVANARADVAGGAARVKIDTMDLTGASMHSKPRLQAKALVIGGLDAELTDGILALGKADEAKTKPAAKPGAMPAVALRRFEIRQGSKLHFHDASVKPEVDVTVVLQKLVARNIDTAKPSQRSAVELVATVNEFTDTQLSGWVAPFGEKPDFELAGKLENMELPPYSPYAAKALGVNLESGKVSATTKGVAVKGKLDATVDLVARHLGFSPLSPEDAKRISAEVGAPVETVVGLLEDADGTITLTIPVGGSVEAPEPDVSQAVGKAVAGAMKFLFPPAALVSLLSSGGQRGGVALEPIRFGAGSPELGEAGTSHADNIVKLLRERPKLSLDVCGRATAADFEAYARNIPSSGGKKLAEMSPELRARLLEQASGPLTELAKSRTQAARRYLVTDKGISASQLGECRSGFDVADQGDPRVAIVFSGGSGDAPAPAAPQASGDQQ